MKNIILLLKLFTLVVTTYSIVPSYIKVCGRKNPELDKCIKNSIELLRPKFKNGIPELSVPSADPFFLPEGLPLANSRDLQASARNVNLHNFSNFELVGLHLDLEKKKIDFDVFFRKIKLVGDFDVKAKIVVELAGTGPIEIHAENVSGKGFLVYQLVDTKKGKRMYFSSMTLKLAIEDFESKYESNSGPNAAFNDAINAVLNTNRLEIIEGIIPSIEKAVSTKILEIANQICKKFTYDELFPDRE